MSKTSYNSSNRNTSNKNSKTTNSKANNKTTNNKPNPKPNNRPANNKDIEKDNKISNEVKTIALIGFAILFLIIIVSSTGGVLGEMIRNISFGLFGLGAYAIPFVCLYVAFYLYKNKNAIVDYKLIGFGILAFTCLLMLINLVTKGYEYTSLEVFRSEYSQKYVNGKDVVTGGFFGALYSNMFVKLFGVVGCYVISIVGFIIFSVLASRKSFLQLAEQLGVKASNKIADTKKTSNERKQKLQEQRELQQKEEKEKVEKYKEEEIVIKNENNNNRVNDNANKNKNRPPVSRGNRPPVSKNKQKKSSVKVIKIIKDKQLAKKELKLQKPVKIFDIAEREEKETQTIQLIQEDMKIENMPKTPEIIENNIDKNVVFEKTEEQIKMEKQAAFNEIGREVSERKFVYQPKKSTDLTYEDINIKLDNDVEEAEDLKNLYEKSRSVDYSITNNEDKIIVPVKEDNIIRGVFDNEYEKSQKEKTQFEREDNYHSNIEDNGYSYTEVVGEVQSESIDVDEWLEEIEVFENSGFDIDDVEDEYEKQVKLMQEAAVKANSDEFVARSEKIVTKQEEVDKHNEIKKHIQKEQITLTQNVRKVNREAMKEHIFPPIELLKMPSKKGETSFVDIEGNSKKLEDTLLSFGVKAKVVEVNKGPTVTRYEIQPGPGVKVSKIANLSDDLALNLAASGIRIQAPIPGKAAVGIEVPNEVSESVFLREVLDTKDFSEYDSNLAFAMGKDIAGKSVVSDIAKMPHMLVAGATGSGKSVCINTLITSILYKAKPSEVKLLMIDPKVVELSIYNGIPHLIIPVVTDPKKASSALQWAVSEMEKRYGYFAESNVRDLKGYNRYLKENTELEPLPQIVIIIDELADLMMTAAKEVEDSICRLAQMARAAGIHLIIATQRPSVDVITGIIKANIPSRLAFSVSSGIDSRTILDTVGAEKLLGKGDMLFSPIGSNEPLRIQGAFVSDSEVESIVSFLKENSVQYYDDSIIQEITSTNTVGTIDKEDEDELLDDAMNFFIEKERASASMIQSRFRIGYSRAARIVDTLEMNGYISEANGSKPREVLVSKEEWDNR